ncbi:MAG: hypothetical protein ACLTYN_07120 [Dysosmobacter welbionis]
MPPPWASRTAIEKFETAANPTQDQQNKLASYFGVSLFYLRGDQRHHPDVRLDGRGVSDEPAPVPPPGGRQ